MNDCYLFAWAAIVWLLVETSICCAIARRPPCNYRMVLHVTNVRNAREENTVTNVTVFLNHCFYIERERSDA